MRILRRRPKPSPGDQHDGRPAIVRTLTGVTQPHRYVSTSQAAATSNHGRAGTTRRHRDSSAGPAPDDHQPCRVTPFLDEQHRASVAGHAAAVTEIHNCSFDSANRSLQRACQPPGSAGPRQAPALPQPKRPSTEFIAHVAAAVDDIRFPTSWFIDASASRRATLRLWPRVSRILARLQARAAAASSATQP